MVLLCVAAWPTMAQENLSLLTDRAETAQPSGTAPLLDEGFEDAWPPAGWSLYALAGADFGQGMTGTAGSFGGPNTGTYFAWHDDTSGSQNAWLVTPALVPTASSELQLWHRNRYMAWYGYSGVLVSTGSCDPNDGEFVELAEFDQAAADWALAVIPLGAYDGQSICLAFNYQGDYSHEWYLDDVSVIEAGDPQIEVTPGAISESLVAGQSTTVPLDISNIGTGLLSWSLAESANAGDCNDLQDLPWLAAAPAAGSVVEGESTEVTVTLDATALAADTYTASLCITSDSVTDAELVVPVTFEVLPLLLPEIDVTPDSVNLTVTTGDGPIPVDIRIDNPGTATLNWTVQTAPDTGAVLWEQVVNGTSGIVSDFFIGSDAGAYSANDFEVSSATTLSTIFAPGFDNTNSLAAQPEITWQVYTDDGGVPAGHPEDGTNGASALWTYTAAIGASGVDVTDNNITLDLLAAGESLNLAPGTYWLSVFPSYNVTGAGGARWNWYQAAQVGAQTHLVSPGVFGTADWTALGDLGVTFTDTAFRLDEVVECDFGWITPDINGGTVDAGSFVEFSLVLDETGLPLGVHTGNLCIASDASGEELIIVPVTLTIEEGPITGLAAGNDGPVVIGDPVNLTASLTGGTNVSFDWDFGDGNFGSGTAPSHLYAAPGVYTATVTASNSVSSEQATTEVQVLGLYTVGGTVSGLAGSGLVLQNNGGDDLAIAANGGFTFATALTDQSSYEVTVATQPDHPVQTCTVANGSGMLAGADVTDVQVTCATDTFTVGGTVSGLAGSGLVLQNNGGDDLAIAADGGFTFATALADQSSYEVTVATQPDDPVQTCTVANGSGTLAGADVTDVQVTCATDTFTVGGTVSGLAGSGLVLQNNGGDDLAIAADGGFTFATALADQSSYEVTIATQPGNPIQSCTVANGSGTLAGSNVSDVAVQCSTEPAALVLDVSMLDFGTWMNGEQDTRVVTLTSSGTGELDITQISAPDAPFELIGGSCLPVPMQLQPGESCEIEIAFAPGENDAGLFESSVEIVSNADSSPDEITLRGMARTAIPVPVLGPFGLALLALMLGVLAFRQRARSTG